MMPWRSSQALAAAALLGPVGRELDQDEIGDARVDLQPEPGQRLGEPGQPAVVVGARALLMVQVLERGDARDLRRRR